MKRILFSCIGTSDPVRNLRDGPWLHIMRHYRPEVVYVFLSAEMARIEQQDHRCEKTIQFIQSRWDDYRVEYVPIESDIEDASDMDLLDRPLADAVSDLVKKYPDDEILLNLSSGTPQMDVILSLIATDEQYKNVCGIQVKNPEKKSGSSERTNKNDYIPEEHLELNDDEEPGMPNRCLEPKMISLEKKKRREQIQTLIKHYNYGAVSDMKESMPRELMALVRHLDARFHLDNEKAHCCGKAAGVPFSLYPCYHNPSDTKSDYHEVVEYYLTLKNLTKMRRFTDYVLRLNPFIIRLQRTALNRYLSYPLSQITDKCSGRVTFSCSKLEMKDPDLLAYLDQETGGFKDSNLSIFANNLILQHLENVPPEIMDLFSVYGMLNEKRNIAAHQLADITDRQIADICGKNSYQLNQMIEKCMPLLYPQCNPAIFQIYERCNQYILEHFN